MPRKPQTVGVRQLRQNLSVYLAQVKKGRSLLVTEHGHVVAELRPLRSGETLIDRLVAEGRVLTASRAISGLPRPMRVSLDRPLSEALEEMRADTV